jgi:hypothetical protein
VPRGPRRRTREFHSGTSSHDRRWENRCDGHQGAGTVLDVTAAHEALTDHRWDDAFELLSKLGTPRVPSGQKTCAPSPKAAWFNRHTTDLAIELKDGPSRRILDRGDRIAAAPRRRRRSRIRDEAEGVRSPARGSRGPSVSWRTSPRASPRIPLPRQERRGGGSRRLRRSGRSLAERATEIGSRFGDADLQAWGLIERGTYLIKAGRPDEGFPVDGGGDDRRGERRNSRRSSPWVAYCADDRGVPRTRTDFRRASEWTDAAHRWCERQAIQRVPRRLPRAQRGDRGRSREDWTARRKSWKQATQELAAVQRDGRPSPTASTRLGEIPLAARRSRGRRSGSAAGTTPLGRSPQPPLSALVRFAEGKVAAALSGRQRGGRGTSHRAGGHGRACFPAQVEIAIAAGERSRPRGWPPRSSPRSPSRSDRPRCTRASTTRGGKCSSRKATRKEPLRELREAAGHWREVGAPYEVARSRMLLGAAPRRARPRGGRPLGTGGRPRRVRNASERRATSRRWPRGCEAPISARQLPSRCGERSSSPTS